MLLKSLRVTQCSMGCCRYVRNADAPPGILDTVSLRDMKRPTLEIHDRKAKGRTKVILTRNANNVLAQTYAGNQSYCLAGWLGARLGLKLDEGGTRTVYAQLVDRDRS